MKFPILEKHAHDWQPIRKGFPQRICKCGALGVLEIHAGRKSITLAPVDVGDVIRWTDSMAPIQKGDLGMDVATGKARIFTTAAKDLLTADDVAVTSIVSITSADSPYTVATTFDLTTIIANAAGGNIVINLPSAASSSKKIITIKRATSSSNSITITPDGSDTIDDVAGGYLVSALYDSITIQSNGTADWKVTGKIAGATAAAGATTAKKGVISLASALAGTAELPEIKPMAVGLKRIYWQAMNGGIGNFPEDTMSEVLNGTATSGLDPDNRFSRIITTGGSDGNRYQMIYRMAFKVASKYWRTYIRMRFGSVAFTGLRWLYGLSFTDGGIDGYAVMAQNSIGIRFFPFDGDTKFTAWTEKAGAGGGADLTTYDTGITAVLSTAYAMEIELKDGVFKARMLDADDAPIGTEITLSGVNLPSGTISAFATVWASTHAVLGVTTNKTVYTTGIYGEHS